MAKTFDEILNQKAEFYRNKGLDPDTNGFTSLIHAAVSTALIEVATAYKTVDIDSKKEITTSFPQ